MARILKRKDLVNSRLLKDYASWIYCANCNQTVAYLCYVTYDAFDFTYTCSCGNKGKVHIAFDEAQDVRISNKPLIAMKNRLCCAVDQSPLVTFVDKNLESYQCSIVCMGCNEKYTVTKS